MLGIAPPSFSHEFKINTSKVRQKPLQKGQELVSAGQMLRHRVDINVRHVRQSCKSAQAFWSGSGLILMTVSAQSFCLLIVAWNQTYTFVVFRYSVIVYHNF